MRYQSLKLNLIYYYFFFTEWFQTEKEFRIVFEEISPQAKQIPSSFICKNCKTESFTLWLSQFQASPPLPPGHLSGICHFVLEKLQMPHGGAQKYSANSLSWDNTKIVFFSK